MGEEIFVQIETNDASKKIDPCCCAIKALIFGKLKTLRHIPRKASRHIFFFIGEEGGHKDGSVFLTCYPPSPIPGGGLEISLMLTLRSLRYNILQKMKDLMTKLYCYGHEPHNVQRELDYEIYIDIKDNTILVESDSEVIVQKTKKRKIQ